MIKSPTAVFLYQLPKQPIIENKSLLQDYKYQISIHEIPKRLLQRGLETWRSGQLYFNDKFFSLARDLPVVRCPLTTLVTFFFSILFERLSDRVRNYFSIAALSALKISKLKQTTNFLFDDQPDKNCVAN